MANEDFQDKFDKEVMKNNLHRIMLDNLELVGGFLELRTQIFFEVCWKHGMLNRHQAEGLLAMLLESKIIQVKPIPK